MDCLFCEIVKKNIPSKIVFENEYLLAFEDIHPVAPVHVLIIPKMHIKDINDISEQNIEYLTQIMLSIKDIAKMLGIVETGYKLVSNVGKDGGQEVPHLHFHMIGGAKINANISYKND